jgi:hypothetical protein
MVYRKEREVGHYPNFEERVSGLVSLRDYDRVIDTDDKNDYTDFLRDERVGFVSVRFDREKAGHYLKSQNEVYFMPDDMFDKALRCIRGGAIDNKSILAVASRLSNYAVSHKSDGPSVAPILDKLIQAVIRYVVVVGNVDGKFSVEDAVQFARYAQISTDFTTRFQMPEWMALCFTLVITLFALALAFLFMYVVSAIDAPIAMLTDLRWPICIALVAFLLPHAAAVYYRQPLNKIFFAIIVWLAMPGVSCLSPESEFRDVTDAWTCLFVLVLAAMAFGVLRCIRAIARGDGFFKSFSESPFGMVIRLALGLAAYSFLITNFDLGTTMTLFAVVFLVALFFWLVRLCRNVFGHDPEAAWEKFKKSVEEEKRTYPYTGKAYTPWFKEIETDIDLSKYPMSPTGELTEQNINKLPPRKAFRVTGMCFSDSFPVMHSNSSHNLRAGVVTRVLLERTAKLDPEYWDDCRWLFPDTCVHAGDGCHVVARIPEPVGGEDDFEDSLERLEFYTHFNEWNSRFPPARRKLNLDAQADLKLGYNRSLDAYDVFVKRELESGVSYGEYTEGRPRVIQSLLGHPKVVRSPFIYSVSLALKKTWHYRCVCYFASGRTLDELGQWYNYHVPRMPEPVIFTTDFSKYDVHQGEEVITEEIEWLESLGIERHLSHPKSLRRSKLRTLGRGICRKTGARVKFKTGAMRHSGEPETTLCNTRLTMNIVYSFFSGWDRKAIAACGDDNCTILDGKEIRRRAGSLERLLDLFREHCLKLGFPITGEINPLGTVAGEFLSLRFYHTKEGYYPGKKPGRNLARIGFSKVSNGAKETQYLETWCATLRSYLPSSMHVPFLRVYIKECLEHCQQLGIKGEVELPAKFHSWIGSVREPTEQTYADFEAYYGLGRNDEIAFRDRIREHLRKYSFGSVMSDEVVGRLWRLDQ